MRMWIRIYICILPVIHPQIRRSAHPLFTRVQFYDFTKIASSTRRMAGSLPSLQTMVPSIARIQGVLKVKVEVKGHVIRALLWCHEMFAIQYLLTFCLMHSLYEAPFHSPSSINVRQLNVMSTLWNELLCHWRSGCTFRRVRSPLTWYKLQLYAFAIYVTSYIYVYFGEAW